MTKYALVLMLILSVTVAPAQPPVPQAPAAAAAPQAPKAPMAPQPPVPPVPPPAQPYRPPLERALHIGVTGKWWHDAGVAQRLSLTSEQQKKMDDIFQQHRLKLIDLNASLQREEAIMEPLVESDQPDESKIVAQIDKVAQARAELEKANARMLLGIRRVLNQEQWKKLQAEKPGPGGPRPQPVPRRRAE
jgi:periplasmic protein CpxP/Spy